MKWPFKQCKESKLSNSRNAMIYEVDYMLSEKLDIYENDNHLVTCTHVYIYIYIYIYIYRERERERERERANWLKLRVFENMERL